MNAEEAIAYGLADKIEEKRKDNMGYSWKQS